MAESDILGATLLKGGGDPEVPETLPEGETEGEDFSPGELLAAEDMMAAVRQGDAKGFASALQDFLTMRRP